jgi:hypothetical protein
MNDVRHTPGPWLSDEHGYIIQAPARDNDRCIKIISPWIAAAWEGDEEAMANNRLMAAAPDLLAACDAAETMLRCLPDTTTNAGGTKSTMTTRRALLLVRAAIAKAEGRQ